MKTLQSCCLLKLSITVPLVGEEPRPSLDSSVGTRELRAFLPRVWHVDPSQRLSAQECVDSLSIMEKPGLKLGKNWINLWKFSCVGCSWVFYVPIMFLSLKQSWCDLWSLTERNMDQIPKSDAFQLTKEEDLQRHQYEVEEGQGAFVFQEGESFEVRRLGPTDCTYDNAPLQCKVLASYEKCKVLARSMSMFVWIFQEFNSKVEVRSSTVYTGLMVSVISRPARHVHLLLFG